MDPDTIRHIAPLPFCPDAVIFDLDGLMLDSERAAIQCYQEVSRQLATSIEPDFWLQIVGLGDVATRERLITRLGVETAQQLIEQTKDCSIKNIENGIPRREGIIALLDFLMARNVPIAVATSSRTPIAQRKLDSADLLWRFPIVCTASDVKETKPAPDIYRLAAQRLNVSAPRCVVLEDSPTGVRAALAAEMTPIQVPDLIAPAPEVRAWGHRIVNSLAEAQRLLEAVFPT